MREREITFARGDILRQVLKKTGLAAKRPLNLRKGGIDSAHSAQLLRNLRDMSQRAALLSAKLNGLIEFKINPVGVAGPRIMQGLAKGNYPAVESMYSKFAAARAAANPAVKAPVEGAVRSAATGTYGVTSRTFPSMRSPRPVAKPASMRIAAASPAGAQQVAEKAGQEAAQAGAAKPSSWKAGAIGTGIGVGAGALLLAPHGQRQEEEQFSLLLDALIEFEYPASVLEAAWRKWKKPSRKTLGGILKRHDPRSPIPTMVFRDQPHMFAARNYPKEVLQSVWKKLKKPRKPSPYAQSFHGGEYHDDPKWVNKDIKKSRRENKGLSARLDDRIEFARGGYISKGRVLTDPGVSNKAREFFLRIAKQPAGKSKTRQRFRNMLAWSGKKTQKLFSTPDDQIEFEEEKKTPYKTILAGSALTGGVAAGHLKWGGRWEGPKWEKKLWRGTNKGIIGASIFTGGMAAKGLLDERRRRKATNLSARLDKVINFADPRPRNPLGEFSPQDAGGPDPNAMATVYKMPQQQQQQGFGSTAATLLTGGALGAVGGSAGKAGWQGMTHLVKHLAKKAKKVRK